MDFDVARVHGAVVGAGGQRNGRGQLGHHAAQGRIGHLQLARHQARALRERIVLLNLVEQQHILPEATGFWLSEVILTPLDSSEVNCCSVGLV
jgi:hypothetical protein